MEKDQLLENLAYAIHEFLDPSYLNKWVSVKERSVSNIFKNWNISRAYSVAFYQILKEKGFIDKQGDKIAMMYKITTDVIPDAQGLANQIVLRFSELQSKSGYPTSKPCDLQPKQSKKIRMKGMSGEPQFIRREPMNLGEMRFFVHNNLIYEGRVVAIFFKEDEKSSESLYCDLEVSTESGITTVVHSIKQWFTYKKVEDLINRLQHKIVKFKK